MALEYHLSNPFRLPDWRWQRAGELAAGRGLGVTRRDSRPAGYHWIRKALRFRHAMQQQVNSFDEETFHAAMAGRYPDLYWAWRLHQHSHVDVRHSIEAHILARETDFEIGHRFDVPPKVIAAYEAVFFDVRERLDRPKYILFAAIGPDARRIDSTPQTLAKLYGYFLGPRVLDAIENHFASPMWCNTADKVGVALQEDAISTLKLKAALAAKTVPVNGHTQLALLDQFTKFIEIERASDAAGRGQDQLMVHIEALLGSLPLTVGSLVDGKSVGIIPGPGQKQADRGPIAELENKFSAELRFDESVKVATMGLQALGEETLEELESLSFPSHE